MQDAAQSNDGGPRPAETVFDDRPVRWRGTAALVALVPLGFGTQRALALVPEWTDDVYSQGLFPVLQRLLTAGASVARGLPTSLGEALLAILLVAALWRAASGVSGVLRRRRSLRNVGAHGLAQILGVGGALYATFLLVWGFHYSRLPFASHADLDVQPSTPAELTALVQDLAREASELRTYVAQDEEGRMRLTDGRPGVLSQVGPAFAAAARQDPVLAGREPVLRMPLLSPLLTASGISGIYFPFSGEANVNGEVPAASFPFTACHEAAHARGFAREDEANFIAYRVCARSGRPDFRYSGALTAFGYAVSALWRVDAEAAGAALAACSEGVTRDRRAIRDFWTRERTRWTEVAQHTNDLFLKAQGEAQGARSYGRMVDLLLAERRRR